MDENVENFVILLDNTKSTAIKDFRPNRFHVALKGVKEFIETKNQVDHASFISLFIFGKETTVLSGLTKDTSSLLSQIASKKFVNNHPPQGSIAELTFSIENAIQILKDQIQIIGGQSNHVFLITDCYDFHFTPEIAKYIPVLTQLGVKFDVLVYSDKSHTINETEYLQLVTPTNGTFMKFHSKKGILKGIRNFALQQKTDNVSFQMLSLRAKNKEQLSEIAEYLRFPTEEEFQEIKKRNSTIKCQICFSRNSPINNLSFILTGRLCPHCDTPMHLHCAGVWAKKSSEGENIFRCPYCYTLLKLPKEIIKGIEVKKINFDEKDNTTKMIRIKPQNLINTNFECSFCFKEINAKEKNDKVFRCNRCSAKYHVSCLKDMYDKDKSCENCGGKIV
ncbi:hypothetical protein NEF87_000069 [Candidatus Lokiarchaeum ossiferum]|uniref:VWFA domain-containing protein n=1 Tax=Candidatus Lokiarchaeum ossiferum TaxID=2951803 RepID=A0ABY6HMR8_9ARCH|nr:hypothetical protein NEF87_000069 [Candidatus Lokiarchaeum sp. B-35]